MGYARLWTVVFQQVCPPLHRTARERCSAPDHICPASCPMHLPAPPQPDGLPPPGSLASIHPCFGTPCHQMHRPGLPKALSHSLARVHRTRRTRFVHAQEFVPPILINTVVISYGGKEVPHRLTHTPLPIHSQPTEPGPPSPRAPRMPPGRDRLPQTPLAQLHSNSWHHATH